LILITPTKIEGDVSTAVISETPLSSLSDNPTTDEVKEAIVYISQKYGLDYNCYNKIIECESQYTNVCNFEYGCSGGIGYSQLLKSTAQHCSKKMGREIDPHNPKDNLECSAWLLKNEGTGHWGTQYTWWGSWKCWHKSCGQ
jgi:hypothetical protein